MAIYLPPSATQAAPAVSVSLLPTNPDIHVNETPAPRLKLDAEQKILVHEAPRRTSVVPVDPANAKYLDPEVPVRFDVAIADGAPQGDHQVKATITYFYCSKRKGWCRKGKQDVELAVRVD